MLLYLIGARKRKTSRGKKINSIRAQNTKILHQKRNVFRRILLVLLGLLLGLNVYFLNAKTVGHNQLPMPFGIGAAVVQSGSMEPTFSKGDLLFVIDKQNYDVGDIVVYQSKNILVVHRIISTNGTKITTKGDANNTADDPFNAEDIKGTVVACIPAIGYLIDFFKTPLGILLLMGCAILLVELSFRKEKKREAYSEKALRVQYLQEEIRKLKQEMDKDKKSADDF